MPARAADGRQMPHEEPRGPKLRMVEQPFNPGPNPRGIYNFKEIDHTEERYALFDCLVKHFPHVDHHDLESFANHFVKIEGLVNKYEDLSYNDLLKALDDFYQVK